MLVLVFVASDRRSQTSPDDPYGTNKRQWSTSTRKSHYVSGVEIVPPGRISAGGRDIRVADRWPPHSGNIEINIEIPPAGIVFLIKL